MKSKKLLFFILLITIFNLTTMNRVTATSYELNTPSGTTLGLDIKVDTINDITGQMTMEIVSITAAGLDWNVNWNITYKSVEVSRSQFVYSNPAADSDGLDFLLKPDAIIPTPVPEYLTAMANALGSNWTSSENSLIYKNGNLNRTMTYDISSGLLIHYIYGDGEDVFQEYVSSGIPGYEVNILIFSSVFSIIGLVFLYKKKIKEEVVT